MNERWLLARITPPVVGMFSCPVIQGRNAVLHDRPDDQFFMSQ